MSKSSKAKLKIANETLSPNKRDGNSRMILVNKLHQHLTNVVLSRSGLMQSLDPQGDKIDKECGYISTTPTIEQYRKLYDREGLATRIVGVYPDESWSVYPDIYETDRKTRTRFERRIDYIDNKVQLKSELHKLDLLAGLGTCGITLIGVDDPREFYQPPEGISESGEKLKNAPKEREILYLQSFSQDLFKVEEIDRNKRSPRYGWPTMYSIKVSPSDIADISQFGDVSSLEELKVHWTRIHHFADNTLSSKIYGVPRLQPVFNRVYDVRKILGGSGEMFWKGAFPGYSFETFPELTSEGDVDMDSIKEEIEAWAGGLQRYMRLIGMTAKSLAPQVADPTNHLTQQYAYICAAIRVPVRIFFGSETGQMAGLQDIINWNRRLGHRQITNLNPRLIRPMIDRLQLLNVLPEVDEYMTDWKDLNSLSDLEKADVTVKKTQALLQYVTSGSHKIFKPTQYLMNVFGMPLKEASAVVEDAGGEDKIISALEDMIKSDMSGKQPGKVKDPAKKTGTEGKRNSQALANEEELDGD